MTRRNARCSIRADWHRRIARDRRQSVSRSGDAIRADPDYWFWLRRTGGVVDTTRFRAEIARTIDARMAERIANAAKQNRQLLIATTDFDLGVGRAWDLAAEMTRPATLDRAHDVILASCSIPGIFPPVILDDHVHADGGVIANALFPFDLADFKRLGAKLRERGETQPVRVRVWVNHEFLDASRRCRHRSR